MAPRVKRDHHGRKVPRATPDGTVADGWLMCDGTSLATLVTSDTLTPEIEAYIHSYKPRLSPFREAWPMTAAFVVRVVLALRPPTVQSARNSLVVVARIAYWAYETEIPLEEEGVFHPDVVDLFVALPHIPAAKALHDYRPRLRTIGRTVTKRAPWPAMCERISYRPLSHPYTASEEALLLNDIGCQYPTVARAAEAVHHLCLGAGAKSAEVPIVTANDLIKVDGLWCLRLGIGDASRLVVIEQDHVGPILRLAAASPEGPLVHKRGGERDLSDILKRFECGPNTPRPSTRRYRSTWLLRHLGRGTRLDVLAAAAGVRELSGLLSLLEHLRALDPAEARRWMAGGR
ncbi:MAG: hypothetical protein M3256_03475 [Actinomycetota bacterium]|nr:hypothetical protein [Actinomycetota bacterium]